jgi:hypothetical protein
LGPNIFFSLFWSLPSLCPLHNVIYQVPRQNYGVICFGFYGFI